MTPWEMFNMEPEDWEDWMKELGWNVSGDSLTYQKTFQNPLPQLTCEHEWVNVGFTSITEVCKHCDKQR